MENVQKAIKELSGRTIVADMESEAGRMAERRTEVDAAKILSEFTSGTLTITLDDETAKRAREVFGIDKSRAEYEFIKDALEKQIPKKPINVYANVCTERVLVGCHCPNENCENGSLGNNEYQFDCCECCGQRLDWENWSPKK